MLILNFCYCYCYFLWMANGDLYYYKTFIWEALVLVLVYKIRRIGKIIRVYVCWKACLDVFKINVTKNNKSSHLIDKYLHHNRNFYSSLCIGHHNLQPLKYYLKEKQNQKNLMEFNNKSIHIRKISVSVFLSKCNNIILLITWTN